MSIKIEETDFIVCFWYAESFDGDNFLMLLRKQPLHWRLDWRFRRKRDEKIFGSKNEKTFYYAFSGLQTPEKEIFHDGQTTFQLTKVEFPLKRLCQRIDGGPEKFHEVFKRFSYCHSREEKKL